MGDAINTPFDVFLFVVVFVGVPMLLFSLPIIVLVLLSERRYRSLKRRQKNESLDSSTSASE